MSALKVPRRLVEEMIQNCRDGRPNEACGVLAAADGEMVAVIPMTNASASPVRYSLDSREQFDVMYKILPDKGWELGGVYHSHTHTEAYPSPTDVRLATEDVPYVIVSLAADPPDVRAFRIVKENWTDETGTIDEVVVVVT